MDDFDRLMEIQRQTASMIRRESEVDDKIKVLDIISELGRKKKKVQIEAIIIEAYEQGLSEDEVLRVIDELESDGMIKQPEMGYLQMT